MLHRSTEKFSVKVSYYPGGFWIQDSLCIPLMVRFPRVKFNFVDMCWSRQSRIKLPPFYTLPPLTEPKTVLGFWWYHTSDVLWSVFWAHRSVSHILHPSPVSQSPCLCSDFLYLRFGLCTDSCFILFHSIHLPDSQGLLFFMAWMLFCPILNWLFTTSVKTELVGEEI